MGKFLRGLGYFIGGAFISALILLAIFGWSIPVVIGLGFVSGGIAVAGGAVVVLARFGLPWVTKKIIEYNIKSGLLENDPQKKKLRRWLAISNQGEWKEHCWNYRFSSGESLVEFARNASNQYFRKYQNSGEKKNYKALRLSQSYFKSAVMLANEIAIRNNKQPDSLTPFQRFFGWMAKNIGSSGDFTAPRKERAAIFSDLKEDFKTHLPDLSNFKNIPTKADSKLTTYLKDFETLRVALNRSKSKSKLKDSLLNNQIEGKPTPASITQMEEKLRAIQEKIDRRLKTLKSPEPSIPESLSPADTLKSIMETTTDHETKFYGIEEKKPNIRPRGIPPAWASWRIKVKEAQVVNVAQEEQQQEEQQRNLTEEEKHQNRDINLSQVREAGFIAHSQKISAAVALEQISRNYLKAHTKNWCERLLSKLESEGVNRDQVIIEKDLTDRIDDHPFSFETTIEEFDMDLLPLGVRIRKDESLGKLIVEYSDEYFQEQKIGDPTAALRINLTDDISLSQRQKLRLENKDYVDHNYATKRLILPNIEKIQLEEALHTKSITLSPHQQRAIDILFSEDHFRSRYFERDKDIILKNHLLRRINKGNLDLRKTLEFLELIGHYYVKDENWPSINFFPVLFEYYFMLFTEDEVFLNLNLKNLERIAQLQEDNYKRWFAKLSQCVSGGNAVDAYGGTGNFNIISDAFLYWIDMFKESQLPLPSFEELFVTTPFPGSVGNKVFLRLNKYIDCLSIVKKAGRSNLELQVKNICIMPKDLSVAKKYLKAGYGFVHNAMGLEKEPPEDLKWGFKLYKEEFNSAFPQLRNPDYITPQDFKKITYRSDINPFCYRALYLRYIALNVNGEKLAEAISKWEELLKISIDSHDSTPPGYQSLYEEDQMKLHTNLKKNWKKLQDYVLAISQKFEVHEEKEEEELYDEDGVRITADLIKPNPPLKYKYDEQEIDSLLDKLAMNHPIVSRNKDKLKQQILAINNQVDSCRQLGDTVEVFQEKFQQFKNEQFDITEAIALLREAYYRHTSKPNSRGKWLRLEQLIPILLSCSGDDILFQIDTSEGKTVELQIIAIIKALQGHKHDVLTHNEVLASDSAFELEPLATQLCGLTVATKKNSAKEVIDADIYYVDIDTAILDDEQAELAMIKGEDPSLQPRRGQRKSTSVSVDEADDFVYKQAIKTWQIAEESKDGIISKELEAFITKINAIVRTDDRYLEFSTEEQLQNIKQALSDDPYYLTTLTTDDDSLKSWISAAVTAMDYFFKEGYYITKVDKKNDTEKVTLIDEKTTGRLNEDSELADYVHQCIAAWEKANGHPNMIIPNLSDVILSGDIASYMFKYSAYDLLLMSQAEFDERKSHDKKKPILVTTTDNEYKLWGHKDGIWQFTTLHDFKKPDHWTNKSVPISPSDNKEMFEVLKTGHKPSRCGYTGTLGDGDIYESLEDLIDIHEKVVIPRAKRPETNKFAYPLKANEYGITETIYNRLFRLPTIIKDGEKKENNLSEYEEELLNRLKHAKDDKKSSILFCNTSQECDDFRNLLLRNGFSNIQILDDIHDDESIRPAESVIIERAGQKDPPMITIVTAAASRGTNFVNPIDFGFLLKPSLPSITIQKASRLARNGMLGVVYEILNKKDLLPTSQAVLNKPPLTQEEKDSLYKERKMTKEEKERYSQQLTPKEKRDLGSNEVKQYEIKITHDPRLIISDDEKRREEKYPTIIAEQASQKKAMREYRGLFFKMMTETKLDKATRAQVIDTQWKSCYKKLASSPTQAAREDVWSAFEQEFKRSTLKQ